MSVDMLVAFIGPDDDETCDTPDGGCDEAVNGNPYPIDEAPEPGSFACMSKCRHALQLLSDAPVDMPSSTWSASIGFSFDPDQYTTPDTGDQIPAPDAEALGSLAVKIGDGGMLDATPEEIASAISAGDAQYADIKNYVDPEKFAQVGNLLVDAGTQSASDLVDTFLADDDLASLTGILIDNDDAMGYVRGLAAQGFVNSSDAYTVRDALNDATDGGWQVTYRNGTWYVEQGR